MTQQYLDLLQDILDNGTGHDDRTGTGTTRVFGRQIRFDLSKGFPLLTTKKVPFRLVAEELFWFLSGSTDVKKLQAKNVHIWDEWATKEQCARFGREEGDLGPVYGLAWRNFGASLRPASSNRAFADDGVDQLRNVVHQLVHGPNSRRIILTAWDPLQAVQVAVPPCHVFMQFAVIEGRLSCHLYQRSADVFLGVPFNIASYALLTHLLAKVARLDVGDFVHTFGDVHIYSNHREQVAKQLKREPRALPTLKISVSGNAYVMDPDNQELSQLLAYTYDDLKLTGYKPHGRIRAEVSI